MTHDRSLHNFEPPDEFPDLVGHELPSDIQKALPPDIGATYSRSDPDAAPPPGDSQGSRPEATMWTIKLPSEKEDAAVDDDNDHPREGFGGDRTTAPDAAAAFQQGGAKDGGATPQSPTYSLRRIVGKGGMGEVWLATQESLKRPVAVKTIARDTWERLKVEPKMRSRAVAEFEQEAFAAAWLDHPNIVPVHDLGRGAADAPPLLAMKLVSGDSWSELLERDFVQLSEAELLTKHLPILVDVCQAVAFAHARGIIHRDLKPAQVMVGPFGETLLMDWGLAVRFGNPVDSQTPGHSEPMPSEIPTIETASNPAGTPVLMAPEQTTQSTSFLGPWTDIYLLGGTLYFLLTGKFPHQAQSSLAAIRRAMMGEVDSPETAAPDRVIPKPLAELAMHALEHKPRDRPRTVKEFLDRVQDYLSGSSRRRESEELTSLATQQFRSLDQSNSARATEGRESTSARYVVYGEVAEKLGRALELWPENRTARQLRAANLAARLGAEIHADDLILAELHLRELRGLDPADRADVDTDGLERKLTAAIQRRDRRHKLMVVLGTAAAVLFVLHGIALGLLGYTLYRVDRSMTDSIAAADGSRSLELGHSIQRRIGRSVHEELVATGLVSETRGSEIAAEIGREVGMAHVEFVESRNYSEWPSKTPVVIFPMFREVEARIRSRTREEVSAELAAIGRRLVENADSRATQ